MDFVGKRNWFFLMSFLVIVPGIVFLIIAPGLKGGIDFTGGSTITLEFLIPVEQEDLRLELARRDQPDAIVQKMDDRTFFVRTRELKQKEKDDLVEALETELGIPPGVEVLSFDDEPASDSNGGSSLTLSFAKRVSQQDIEAELITRGHSDATVGANDGDIYVVRTRRLGERERNELVAGLESALSPSVDVLSFDLVSPAVARQTVVNAFWAVLAASVGIFFYLWWAFRSVPSPFRYGTAALIALLHDSLIVVGIFAIAGELLNVEVNTMFLIALLTIIGYSVNDTIVVFDRLRENILLYPNRTLVANANISISQSLGRSLNTSLTLLFTLLALLLFGGETIRVFLWVLLIGVVAGTYSSVGIATNVLVLWESGDLGRIFRRIRPSREPSHASGD